MSNKAKSRKKREKQSAELLDAMIKLKLATNIACLQLSELVNFIKSVKFLTSKFYSSGIVSEINNFYEENKENGVPVKFYRDGVQISGGEAIIPVISTGTAPYENDQYMFQED